MRALRLEEWGGELLEVTLSPRKLRADEVRLRVLACGVGMTVLNDIGGDLAGEGWGSLPRVPGHEICGEVIEVAPDVPGIAIGDRGIVYFYLTCGRCRFCRLGREPLCERFRGFVGADIDGGYAEETVVPARNFIDIPSDLDPVAATTIPDAVATPVHICRARARVQPGESLAVIGAGGGIGVHLVQVARLFGADVLGVDVSEEKLGLAREVGATATLPAGSSPEDVVSTLGRRADVVVDTVGTDETLAWALAALEKGGRLVLLTTSPGQRIAESTTRAVLDEIAILGSRYASYADVDLAVRLVAGGSVRPIVGGRASLADVNELHDRLREGILLGRGSLVPHEK